MVNSRFVLFVFTSNRWLRRADTSFWHFVRRRAAATTTTALFTVSTLGLRLQFGPCTSPRLQPRYVAEKSLSSTDIAHFHTCTARPTINDRSAPIENNKLAAPGDAPRSNIHAAALLVHFGMESAGDFTHNAFSTTPLINHTHAVSLTMSLVLFIRGALESFFTDGATGKRVYFQAAMGLLGASLQLLQLMKSTNQATNGLWKSLPKLNGIYFKLLPGDEFHLKALSSSWSS